MKKLICLIVFSIILGLLSSCDNKVEPKSSEKEIVTFSLNEQTGPAVISSVEKSVNVEVEIGTDLSALAPVITVSAGASISPASGDTIDFSQGAVIYTVTAEDNSSKQWQVTVTAAKQNEAKILTFVLEEQSADAVIGDSTVDVITKVYTDLTKLTPQITVSQGASIQPASGEETDFSHGSVNYTVTAEDGTEKVWVVTVTRILSSDKEIISYTVPSQVGESIKSSRNIYVEVPFGTDLSAVVPEIVISQGASISPASGESVDFSVSGSVTYTVTAEDSSTVVWTVYLNWVLIKANNENIQYTGRIDFSNPERPRFWSPGVYIKAKFSGPYLEIVINDEILWGHSHNYLDIVIDGTDRMRIQTTASTNSIKITDGLNEGEHTVLICKDTEASVGHLEFIGFRCAELLPLPAKPTRKLEFIGNSITCGAESDLSGMACDAGVWYDRHNAYLSYGAEVARRLDAQWYLTAYGGLGVIHSCCDFTITMPDVFERIDMSDAADGNWDFSRYVPDAVTICLGQNDGIQDSTAFCSAYVSFIETIRGYYPNAYIILLTSPMADASLTDHLKKCLTGIVNHFNTGGDNKVTSFFFSQSYNSGCGGHPDVAEHQLIADELEPFIKQTLGW